MVQFDHNTVDTSEPEGGRMRKLSSGAAGGLAQW